METHEEPDVPQLLDRVPGKRARTSWRQLDSGPAHFLLGLQLILPSSVLQELHQHQAEGGLHRSGSGEERNPLRSGRQDNDFPRRAKKQREGEADVCS